MGHLNQIEELKSISQELKKHSTLNTTYIPQQESLLKNAKAMLILLRVEAHGYQANTLIKKAIKQIDLTLDNLKSHPTPQVLTDAHNALDELLKHY